MADTKHATAPPPRTAALPRAFAGKYARFLDYYKSDPSERITMIRHGVEPSDVKLLAERMKLTHKHFMQSLGLKTSTVNRKHAQQTPLTRDESERVLGLAKLIGQLEKLMEESRDPDNAVDFNAAQWIGEWVQEPNMALGGKTPITFMDTSEGRDIVSNLISRLQTGAYS